MIGAGRSGTGGLHEKSLYHGRIKFDSNRVEYAIIISLSINNRRFPTNNWESGSHLRGIEFRSPNLLARSPTHVR